MRRQKLRRRSTGRRGDKRPFVDQAGAAEGIDKSTGQGVDAFADRQLDAILDGAAVEEPIQEEEETREEEKGLVICDIPGLVDKASQGVGLGDAFLKHVERCACLLHVVDASRDDPCADYDVISRELQSYSETLANKPRVVLLNTSAKFWRISSPFDKRGTAQAPPREGRAQGRAQQAQRRRWPGRARGRGCPAGRRRRRGERRERVALERVQQRVDARLAGDQQRLAVGREPVWKSPSDLGCMAWAPEI